MTSSILTVKDNFVIYLVQDEEIFQTIPEYYYLGGENNTQKTIQG